MHRRHFLSSFTLVSATAGAAFALRPEAARAMSIEPAPAHFRLGAPVVEGALDWNQMALAGASRFRDGEFSRFPVALRDLDGQRVKLNGYMMPLNQGKEHKEFLLGGLQFHCPACMMSDLGRLAAVRADEPVTYSEYPLLLEGKLVLLENDSSPLLYRLDGARVA